MAQLAYVFVTVTAISTRSDPRIFEGGDFVPVITGVETGSAINIAIEVH